MFSWGLEKGYIITGWWLLSIIAAIGAIPIWYLVEMTGFTEADTDSDTDDEESLLPTEDAVAEASTTAASGGRDVSEETLDVVDGPPLSRVKSRKSVDDGRARSRANSISNLERSLSDAIGMGGASIGPGGRRLSNGLAASNMGQGTGGNTFH